MKSSKNNKKVLLKEIQIVRKKMKEEKDLRKKIFYYSAIYNEISRLYNREYTPHLQFMHLVLNVSYNAMMSRLNMIAGGDTTIPFPDNFFDELDKLLEKMQENIKNEKDTYLVLEKISNLTYLLSGNGYYLSQKGVEVFSP
jgi:CRISPR/Cas system CSM-associated protein Csm4 (group 5 of RAMP superfamily)